MVKPALDLGVGSVQFAPGTSDPECAPLDCRGGISALFGRPAASDEDHANPPAEPGQTGDPGIEPGVAVLETTVLPIHQSPGAPDCRGCSARDRVSAFCLQSRSPRSLRAGRTVVPRLMPRARTLPPGDRTTHVAVLLSREAHGPHHVLHALATLRAPAAPDHRWPRPPCLPDARKPGLQTPRRPFGAQAARERCRQDR